MGPIPLYSSFGDSTVDLRKINKYVNNGDTASANETDISTDKLFSLLLFYVTKPRSGWYKYVLNELMTIQVVVSSQWRRSMQN